MAKTTMTKKVVLVGLGNMGEALLAGALKKGVLKREEVIGVEAVAGRAQEIEKRYKIRVTPNATEAAREAKMIILAVKPKDAAAALKAMGVTGGKLLVSICAGLTIPWLEAHAAPKTKVVRVMPNTPALVGQGAAVYCAGRGVGTEACAEVEAIFGAVGAVHRIADESLLDAVTGLSGSGPAFAFLFLEALADGGVAAGLSREMARALAAQTVLGAAAMALDGKTHTAELKDRVASPAGTTIEGLRVLEDAGVRAAVIEAVVAAAERSRELGGKK
jgi:pyrroline-5-carboxylate reductase